MLNHYRKMNSSGNLIQEGKIPESGKVKKPRDQIAMRDALNGI